jgi:hypothetical protein
MWSVEHVMRAPGCLDQRGGTSSTTFRPVTWRTQRRSTRWCPPPARAPGTSDPTITTGAAEDSGSTGTTDAAGPAGEW